MNKTLLLLFVTLFDINTFAAPIPEPIFKNGSSCPGGYSTSGGSYCKPNSNARFAISKIGSNCPSGYATSGNAYCIATSDNSKAAIPKKSSNCPSGYVTSGGNYCLSH